MKKEKNNKKGGKLKWFLLGFVFIILCNISITWLMTVGKSVIDPILAKEGESFILVTKENCSKCDSMKTILDKLSVEKNIPIYYFNIKKLTADDLKTLTAFGDLINKDQLPNLVHISAGLPIGNYTAVANKDAIMSFYDVFTKISSDQYTTTAKEDTENFFYLGRPTCSHCVESTPWLKRVMYELNKKLYYINTDEISSNEKFQQLMDETKVFKGATPTFIITKSGQVVRSQEGAGSYSDVYKFFSGKNK